MAVKVPHGIPELSLVSSSPILQRLTLCPVHLPRKFSL
jgi:hypothetical protein